MLSTPLGAPYCSSSAGAAGSCMDVTGSGSLEGSRVGAELACDDC